jgi:hypothetical protein
MMTDEGAPLSADEVETVLSTLSRALRAFQMYEANNPVFQRFEEALRRDFEALWAKADMLELEVSEEGFVYGDRVIAVGQGRSSLAFAFYKDGIRYLKFLPGFEDEVGAFVDVIRRARRSAADDEDMISVLWEGDFASLQYGYVDALSEGLALPERAGAAGPATVIPPLELEGGDEGAEEVSSGLLSSMVTAEDFDETLYFLDPAEMAALRREVELEMERDVRQDVVNALFDRLEEGDRPDRQAEIMDILDQLLPLFLGRGDMGSAAQVLEELDRLARASGGELATRVDQVFRRLGEPEVLEQFVHAMEDGEISPSADEVGLFFSRLPVEALPVLLRFAESSTASAVRDRLAAAVDGVAGKHPSAVGEMLASGDAVLVKGAARAAGRRGMGPLVPGLRAALDHPEPEVRLAVVDALVAIRLTPALHALTGALRDSDREVRIAAAKGLGAVRFASARDVLAEAVAERRLKDADLTEKMAFYEAYGAVGGNAAAEYLDGVLNHRGFLGRRAPPELRACAALGLGKVGTPVALEALERSRHDEDPVVRNAVLRALREETTP